MCLLWISNVDVCEFQNCCGNGECIDGINSYTCVCNIGFTGMNYKTNVDDCVNQDCSGHSTYIDGVNSFSCNCDPLFTGSLCERIDYCYRVNCNSSNLSRSVSNFISVVWSCTVSANILISLVIAILDSLENCVVWICN